MEREEIGERRIDGERERERERERARAREKVGEREREREREREVTRQGEDQDGHHEELPVIQSFIHIYICIISIYLPVIQSR